MPPEPVTVHIVDDDDGLRLALCTLFTGRGYMARGYADADSFLSAPIDLGLGCIIVDLRMPGMNGLELQKRLTERSCLLPVLFLSGQADVRAAVTAMKEGAVEFLEKPVTNDVLLAAVDRAVETSRFHVERARFLDALTARERDILGDIEQGLQNKQIAFKLKISEKTVEFHKKNIRVKENLAAAGRNSFQTDGIPGKGVSST